MKPQFKVTRAVILAAGYGTRFLPASRVVAKEVFPLIDTPAIQYIIDELIAAGITEILVITSRRKRALDEWFDSDPELHAVFTTDGAHKKLAQIAPPQVDVYFRRQPKMGGTGDALLFVENWTRGEPFIVAYPDDIVVGEVGLTQQLITTFERTGRTVLAGQPLDGDVSRYGVIGYESVNDIDLVTSMIEKPAPGEEPSKVVSYGRYLYTADIFDALRLARDNFEGPGEFTQTHALREMLGQRLVSLCQFTGTVLDVGTPMGYLTASVEMGLRRPELRDQTLVMLASIAKREGLV